MAIRVGIVGLGMMGTTHFRGYGQIEGAEVGLAFGWRGVPTTGGAAVILSN